MLVQAGVTTGLTRFHMVDAFIIFPSPSMMVTGSSGVFITSHSTSHSPTIMSRVIGETNHKNTTGSPHLGFLEKNSSVQNEAAAPGCSYCIYLLLKNGVCSLELVTQVRDSFSNCTVTVIQAKIIIIIKKSCWRHAKIRRRLFRTPPPLRALELACLF